MRIKVRVTRVHEGFVNIGDLPVDTVLSLFEDDDTMVNEWELNLKLVSLEAVRTDVSK